MRKLIQECFFFLRSIGAIDQSYESLDICSSVMKLGSYHFLSGLVGVHLDEFLVPSEGDATSVTLRIYCDHFDLSPIMLDYCLSLLPRKFCFLQY